MANEILSPEERRKLSAELAAIAPWPTLWMTSLYRALATIDALERQVEELRATYDATLISLAEVLARAALTRTETPTESGR